MVDATDKIGIKVAKMKAADNGERYMGIPTVTMPRIQELQEKARREGKTLADVYKEEEVAKKPSQFVGTMEEVQAAIAAKKNQEVVEEPLAPPDAEPLAPPESEPVEEEAQAGVEVDLRDPEGPKEPEQVVDQDDLEKFVTAASERTIKELRDFARTAGIPISSVRKDDIVLELADDILKEYEGYEMFYEFFAAEPTE